MKRLISLTMLAMFLILFLPSNSTQAMNRFYQFKSIYKQFTASGNNQEVLGVGSNEYCHVAFVSLINAGSTTATVTIHFEGTADADNRLHIPNTFASGEGLMEDIGANSGLLIGGKGEDIDIDISANATINVFILYFTQSSKEN